MLLTVFKRQCERLLIDCQSGACDKAAARFRIQQLTVVRDNTDNVNRKFVMTLFLQQYRKYVADYFREHTVYDVKPISLL